MKTLILVNKYLSHFWFSLSFVVISLWLYSIFGGTWAPSIISEHPLNVASILFFELMLLPAIISVVLGLLLLTICKSKQRFYGAAVAILASLSLSLLLHTLILLDYKVLYPNPYKVHIDKISVSKK